MAHGDLVFPHLLNDSAADANLPLNAIKVPRICLVVLKRVFDVGERWWATDSMRSVVEGGDDGDGVELCEHNRRDDEVDTGLQFLAEADK